MEGQVCRWKAGIGEIDREGQEGVPQSLPLSQQGLEELSELQVDPILGIQDDLWEGDGNLERICRQLKAKQGQGHSHLQLLHGEILPNAVS